MKYDKVERICLTIIIILLISIVAAQFRLSATNRRLQVQVDSMSGEIEIASDKLSDFVEKWNVGEVSATAYTHTGNQTYTGTWPKVGTIAVDPTVIPLGSRIFVPGYGWGVAADTGRLIIGNRIDLFMDTREKALDWGRRDVPMVWARD